MAENDNLTGGFKTGLGAGCGCLAAPIVGLFFLYAIGGSLSETVAEPAEEISEYDIEQERVGAITVQLLSYSHVSSADYSDFIERWTVGADRADLLKIDTLPAWHRGFCTIVRDGGMTEPDIELAIIDRKQCGKSVKNSCAVIYEGRCP